MNSLSIKEFLAKAQSIPVIDVRSPAEFAKGHISGAVSIPLFDNNERAEIGTIYKQDAKSTAIKKGLQFVGPKMNELIDEAEKLNSHELLIHCWRGGMRSESMAWLYNLYGFKMGVLSGGYKSFRNYVIDYFKSPIQLNVITGNTGSGKTELLHILKEKGEQVIDLEGLANHQGSSFGNQKSAYQPTTEQFQNNLFSQFEKLDNNKSIWIEDESICIGQVVLPQELFDQMARSPYYLIQVDKEYRIQRLVKDYGGIEKDKLLQATLAISKKLGFDQTKLAMEYIKNDQLKEAVDIIITYYDKNYTRSMQKKKSHIIHSFSNPENDLSHIAEQLIENKYVY